MKKCNFCFIEKDLKEFPKTGKKCKTCIKKYKENYALNNKEKIIEGRKKYNLDNKKKVKKSKSNYYKNNIEVIKEKSKTYALINIDKIKEYRKEYNIENYSVEYQKEYRKYNKLDLSNKKKEYYLNKDKVVTKKEVIKLPNSIYKLKCSLRTNILKSFKDNKIKKSTKIIDIIGCSFEEFVKHIESKFNDKMTWDNFIHYWELSYIIPMSYAKTNLDIIALNNYKNFQPKYWLEIL